MNNPHAMLSAPSGTMATIDPHEWITIASCAGHLGLATIALRRISSSPLGLPLALLCLDLFIFNAADVAGHLTAAPQWVWLDLSCAALMVPLAIRFALAFVGRTRALRWLAYGFDLYFGLTALACSTAFLGLDWGRAFADPAVFARATAPGAVAAILALGYLFVSHLRVTHSPAEQARTWLVISGIAIGAAGNTCDLLANAGFAVPRLGPLSLLITTMVLTLAALRVGLFERRISWLIAANGLGLGSLLLAGYLGIYYFLGNNSAVFAVGIGTLVLGLVAVLLGMIRAASAQRERLEYHATLGRFSAQMAHDLRNPLAAIKGAAQYLKEEQARGNSLAEARDFLSLIIDQADRLDRVVTDYRRIGRIEAVLQPLDLHALVEQVLGSQALAAPATIKLERRLAAEGSKCRADADLISAALENLVRNAFEAMPSGGVVTVHTETPSGAPGFVRLCVADTGQGMDPRLAEQAFADFFTTKASGSGLGLAFVRRVAEAHGGEARMISVEGKGTTVQLLLPLSAAS